jgi:hypothetical protein
MFKLAWSLCYNLLSIIVIYKVGESNVECVRFYGLYILLTNWRKKAMIAQERKLKTVSSADSALDLELV